MVKINCGYCEKGNKQVIDVIAIEMGKDGIPLGGCLGVVAYTLRG